MFVDCERFSVDQGVSNDLVRGIGRNVGAFILSVFMREEENLGILFIINVTEDC